MKKTAVWHFTAMKDSIYNLVDENVIDVRFWMNRKPEELNKNEFQMNHFQNSHCLLSFYEKAYKNYTQKVPFNSEVYLKLYSNIDIFMSIFTRHQEKFETLGYYWHLDQFNILYNFFYGMLTKESIDLVLFGTIPHIGPEIVLYLLAKELNIRTILIAPNLQTQKQLFYLENIEQFGDFDHIPIQNAYETIKIENKFEKDLYYMKNIKEYNYTFWNLLKELKQEHKRIDRAFKDFLKKAPKLNKVREYKKTLKRISKKPDFNKKYVYFPLHLQPEMTTTPLGGIYKDQALAIERLSELIPSDWIIYVKENPKQKEFMRQCSFWQRLNILENVQVVPIETNTYDLIKNSQFVATITGTVGWEAITGGKPVLIFGNAWYKNFPGVFSYDKVKDVKQIITCKINHQELEYKYSEMFSKLVDAMLGDTAIRELNPNLNRKENSRNISNFLKTII